MSNISISDLPSTGSDLFSDSESYMSELDDSELNIINGGLSPGFVILVATGIVLAGAKPAH